LVDAARAAGMPVIFVWHVDEPGHRDSTRNAKLFRDIVEANGLVRGTWGVAPVAGLEPQNGDAVVEKQRMSAFNATTLDTKLRGPRPDEVLVRIAAVGICGTDLHVVKGDWDRPKPMVLGHEGAGVVEAVGDAVDGLAEGDAVVLSWAPSCGRCADCVRGRPA